MYVKDDGGNISRGWKDEFHFEERDSEKNTILYVFTRRRYKRNNMIY